jgi:membrane-associated phospholipid phosphatase
MLYPLAMGFTLVYTGEHYVIDILIGWAYAAVVYFAGSRFLAWWLRRRAQRRAAAPLASAS